MNTSYFYLLATLCLWISSCQTPDQVNPLPISKTIVAQPAEHGLVVFGSDTIFLTNSTPIGGHSHYQIILKATLRKGTMDVQHFYNLDRRRTLSQTYTLKTEPFHMADLFATEDSLPLRRSFRATLYRGQHGKDGMPILEDVIVKVEKVILARKLHVTFDQKPLAYFVFGTKRELFAVHWKAAGSDFEHIVHLGMLEGGLTHSQSQTVRNGALLVTSLPNSAQFAWPIGKATHAQLFMRSGTHAITFDVLKSHR